MFLLLLIVMELNEQMKQLEILGVSEHRVNSSPYYFKDDIRGFTDISILTY